MVGEDTPNSAPSRHMVVRWYTVTSSARSASDRLHGRPCIVPLPPCFRTALSSREDCVTRTYANDPTHTCSASNPSQIGKCPARALVQHPSMPFP